MRVKELESLAKRYLISNLPGFDAKGTLIYATPIDYFLRGFAFDTSGYRNRTFSMWVFVQPLCIPSSHVWLNLGYRLGTLGGRSEHWWNIENGVQEIAQDILEYIRAEGIPFVDKVLTPRDFIKKVRGLTNAPDEPIVKEAWCYALILAGEHAKALTELEHLSNSIDKFMTQYPYLHRLAENRQRIDEILAALRIDSDSTRVILDRWRAKTLASMKLI